MPTSTVTRATVDLPNDSTWKLIVDTSSKVKVNITSWLGSASGMLLLRFQTAQPDPSDVPDAVIGRYATWPEHYQRYTGKIWGIVFNDHVDDVCYVAEFDT